MCIFVCNLNKQNNCQCPVLNFQFSVSSLPVVFSSSWMCKWPWARDRDSYRYIERARLCGMPMWNAIARRDNRIMATTDKSSFLSFSASCNCLKLGEHNRPNWSESKAEDESIADELGNGRIEIYYFWSCKSILKLIGKGKWFSKSLQTLKRQTHNYPNYPYVS